MSKPSILSSEKENNPKYDKIFIHNIDPINIDQIHNSIANLQEYIEQKKIPVLKKV